MTAGKIYNGWTLIAILLVVIIAASSLVIWSKNSRSQAIEISIAPDPEMPGEIYIGGEVSNPGFYSLKAGDSVDDIIRTAGGTTAEADLNQLVLHVLKLTEEKPPQRVDINKAEAWLLAALPGIGEVRAQAIIDYRQKNGLFRNINELAEVPGIGAATLEKIKHLITVAD